MKEQTLQKNILDWLNRLEGVCAYKIISANIAGVPDIIGVVHGRFFAVEVKLNRTKPTSLQLYQLDKIRKCGGFGFTVNPSNINNFKDHFITIHKETHNED